MPKHTLRTLIQFTFLLVLALFGQLSLAGSNPEVVDANFFEQKVRPIFDARCIACHSCMDSPCQLNLQTADGLIRGAHSLNLYDGGRSNEVLPTRMFEDAQNIVDWRGMGFSSVTDGGKDSILMRMIELANVRKEMPTTPARDSMVCPKDPESMLEVERKQPELAMPYGLPALDQNEQQTIRQWITQASPQLQKIARTRALSLDGLTATQLAEVRRWEDFLNQPGLEQRLVARYLYEHLFLAHFYFADESQQLGTSQPFLKLVRSRTKCADAIDPIATRRPNEDPGMANWSYCFYRDPATIVYKTHIPYPMSSQKLAWIKHNFFAKPWKATKFPTFNNEVAANPHVAFAEMPVEPRYRFLLEDARYHIMTFIKGPVCNGTTAVNVIQEQFYVMFMDPNSDLMVKSKAFTKESASLLQLPAGLDTRGKITEIVKDYKKLGEIRTAYRKLHNREMEQHFPRGLGLNDIWNGNGTNKNALLTVFRHDDNSDVSYGAVGDASKTVFVLDYSIFERLVYNLVVNFDVFGEINHQAQTRLYMDFLRSESEENYLEFMPLAARKQVKDNWYRGMLTKLKLLLLDETEFANIPSGIKFEERGDAHLQLLQKLIFERIPSQVRGENDALNWKRLKPGLMPADEQEANLSKITSIAALRKTPFARYFPEVSQLLLVSDDSEARVYTIIHNREHNNVSWMMAEGLRRAPEEDTLTIARGARGGYPNLFFAINEKDLPKFVLDITKVGSETQFKKLVQKWGVERTNPAFWSKYDAIHSVLRKSMPLEYGVLDLSRYYME